MCETTLPKGLGWGGRVGEFSRVPPLTTCASPLATSQVLHRKGSTHLVAGCASFILRIPRTCSCVMCKHKTYVAVVDDDESFARALGRLLRASGFEVVLHPSAEAFLRADPLRRPDCLVLDIHLGGMSGLELQQQLAALGSTLPIIFVTAHDEPELRRQAEKAGCVAVLAQTGSPGRAAGSYQEGRQSMRPPNLELSVQRILAPP